jgi:O-antigen/teichoic acid export membrane protein
MEMAQSDWGAACFGLVIGWIVYRTLRRREGAAALSDVATVIGAIGGGAVTTVFKSQELFGAYAIGLAIGFFGYLIVSWVVYGKEEVGRFMGD